MIHRPSLAAFAADLARLAGTLLAAAVVADYRAEARAAVRDVARTEKAASWLAADNMRLQAEVDTLRAELVKARAEIDRAWGLDSEHVAEWEREIAYDREGEQ